jgi:DNA-binding transcriptional LysR family regulator
MPPRDKALRDAGIERKVGLQLRHFSAIPAVLPGSDLVATLPMRAAEILSSSGPLKCVDLPMEVPELEVRLHWDARRSTHASISWFLDLVTSEVRSFPGNMRPGSTEPQSTIRS